MRKKDSSNMFDPPQRKDYDPGMLGDTAYQWAMERYLMENHKLGPGYAASVANDLEETRVNQNGVKQTGKSNKIR